MRRGSTYELDPETQKQYEAAVDLIKVARGFLPVWRSFARVLTGDKKIKVQLGDRSQTDGKTIWLRIPTEWAGSHKHDRQLCGKRDELSIMRCEACATREAVNIVIIHEIGHITQ